MSKLRRQVMQAVNIKVEDTQGQTKPIYDLYKDSLDDVLNNNINDTMARIIDMNPCPLKQTTLATQPRTPFDVPLPLRLFSEETSGENKNSNSSAKKSSSPMFLPNIVPREPSNSLLRPSGNYDKQRKGKPRVVLASWDLGDLGYITNQSSSQSTSAMSKNNANSTESYWRNQTQKSSNVVRE